MKQENAWATEICKKVSALYNDNFNIPVYEDDNLPKATLGITYFKNFKPTAIAINANFMKYASTASVINTIKHEWAHYYLGKTGIYTCNTKKFHNKDFELLCLQIGCEDFLSTKADSADYDSKVWKYVLYCPHCGKILGGYDRKCKTLKQINFVKCGYCGNYGVEYKENK